MKVAIRADASQAIGTGHIRRCLALAGALRDLGAEVRFVIRDLGVDAGAIVTDHGFALLTLPAPPPDAPIRSTLAHAGWAGVDAQTDATETAALLGDWFPDWMVVDHYAFDAEWHDTVRQALGCRVAAIDDLADRPLAVDVIVDHNYNADHRAKYAGSLRPGTVMLGGPRFALISSAFAEAPRYVCGDTARSVGIFMGGIDAAGLSTIALDAIGLAGFARVVEIVATSANPHLSRLRAAAAARGQTELQIDLPDLAAFFARHDVQIGAGGGASWERCCIGAPTILLVAADNQLAVVPALVAEGVVLSPEPLGTLDPADIAQSLQRLLHDAALRRDLSARSVAQVDGLGARRVALRLASDQLWVKPATHADARRMHDWRDHPVTRGVSRETGAIAWADHLAWLDRVLADPQRTLLIGMIGDVAIGVVRFDRRPDGGAEVSLYLDPALHGLGLGAAMLRAGEEAVADLDIHAEVLEGNSGSARLFASAGFRRVDATHWIKQAN